MKQETLYGGALIASTFALLATGALHPTGAQMLASPESLEAVGFKNMVVHGLALFGVWLALFGLVGLSRKLGFARSDVQAAFIAFALAAVAVVLAAVVDGLVVRRLAGGYFDADEATRLLIKQQLRFCGALASSLTRFYVTAVSVAILLWSWAGWRTRFNKALPWVGVVVALPALIAQALGFLHMNVHDVLVLALGQGVWTIWTGVVLVRLPAANSAN